MDEWKEQVRNKINSLEKLQQYINVSDDEREAIQTLKTKWWTISIRKKRSPNWCLA